MKDLFIFLLGGAAGSLITWKLVEKKYKRIADEEIESVKQTFKEKSSSISKENSYEAYKDIIREMNYENNENNEVIQTSPTKEMTTTVIGDMDNKITAIESNISTIAEKKEEPKINGIPFIISPEDFGEVGYDTKSWTLYSDGILVDEFDQIVEEPELYLGDALKHFGEYEDDTVYVRNHNEETDYEVLRVTEEFSKLY